jgi:hypothetical protein
MIKPEPKLDMLALGLGFGVWDLQIPSTNPKFGMSSLGFERLGMCSAYPKPNASPWDMPIVSRSAESTQVRVREES